MHATDEAIDRWVTGDPDGAAVLEAHAETCPECAARLSAAARTELALHEVAEHAAARARWPSLVPWGAVVALAAGLLVAAWVALPERPTGALVDASAGCAGASCAARGIMTDPRDIPRYDRSDRCLRDCGGPR